MPDDPAERAAVQAALDAAHKRLAEQDRQTFREALNASMGRSTPD